MSNIASSSLVREFNKLMCLYLNGKKQPLSDSSETIIMSNFS
jgi:hypothetical protein